MSVLDPVRLRFGVVLSLVVLPFSCRPHESSAVPPAASNLSAGRAKVDAAAQPNGPRTTDAGAAGESFSLERWSFSLGAVGVSIEDLHLKGDLTAPLSANAAAILAVNGGFFGPAGEPIGLAVSNGTTLAPFAPQLSGGVLVIDGGRASVLETERFDPSTHESFAIQCRPRLVVRGAANVKRDDGQRAERTALCVRDGGATLEVLLARSSEGGPSLFALAQVLAREGCDDALNLDGGPSTGAAWRDESEVHLARPRGPIRLAIVVTRR